MILHSFVKVQNFLLVQHVVERVQVFLYAGLNHKYLLKFFLFKAQQNISCVDMFWFCSSMKSGCNVGIINATLTVRAACAYTCGACSSYTI
jgi:hypothetical protein